MKEGSVTETITAIFHNLEFARAAYQILEDYSFPKRVKVFSRENQDQIQQYEQLDENDYLQHCLNQGAGVIQLETDHDNWIAAHEILRSLAGEVYHHNDMDEVFQEMYQIPNEADGENREMREVEGENLEELKDEVGTYGYPYDLLDDNAYIDPNIGVGDHDLLKPYYPPHEYERYQSEVD